MHSLHDTSPAHSHAMLERCDPLLIKPCMDLTAPASAPTSSFIIDDDAAESVRTGIASASGNTPEQQGYHLAEPASATAVMAPESSLSAKATGEERHLQTLLASPHLNAVAATEDMQQTETDPICAASLLELTNGQSLAQAYALQPPEAAAAPQTASQALEGQPQQTADSNAAAPSIAEVLGQLKDNAAGIQAAEEVLQHLLAKQSMLLQLERKLEQQHVISAVTHPLGFHLGRPVAAVLLLRCCQEWGVFTAEEAPVLEQLSCVLQEQLCMEDESAPADVAGLQCSVAYWLTVSSVLLCLLLKTTNPSLAAAHSTAARSSKGRASEVVTAARKRVGELQQHLAERVGHMGGIQGGLQALGRRFGRWGKGAAAKHEDGSIAADTGAGSPLGADTTAERDKRAESAATDADADAVAAAGDGVEVGAKAETPAAAAAALGVTGHSSSSSTSSNIPSTGLLRPRTVSTGAAAVVVKPSAAVGAFMLSLDTLVQKSFIMLRDQLKRRLTPLLSDCMMNPGLVSQETLSSVTSLEGTDSLTSTEGLRSRSSLISMGSYNHAGAAVGGAAAANRKEAEAVLMNFRSWSELVGVLHAAVVALRGAGVPRALTAVLVQQVLEFINCQMFNQLLLRPECCSANNARYVLRGLKQLDGWILAEHSACGHEAPWSPSRTPTPTGLMSTTPTATGAPAAAAAGTGNGATDSAADDTAAAATATAAAAASDGGKKKSPWADAAVAAAAAADDPSWEQIAADGDFSSWQPPKQQQGVRLWQQQQQQGEGQQQQPLQHDIGPEAWHALSHVRQALQFLVLEHKGALSLDELSTQICPALNYQQLYRLCTTAWTDAPGEDGCVSGEVLEEMKQREKLSTNGGLIVTFLLDDPTTLPFVAAVAAAAAAGEASYQVEPSSMSAVSVASTNASIRSGSSSSGSMRCKPSSVVLWDDGRNYGVGMPVPAALVDDSCPASVFGFLQEDRPWLHY